MRNLQEEKDKANTHEGNQPHKLIKLDGHSLPNLREALRQHQCSNSVTKKEYEDGLRFFREAKASYFGEGNLLRPTDPPKIIKSFLPDKFDILGPIKPSIYAYDLTMRGVLLKYCKEKLQQNKHSTSDAFEAKLERVRQAILKIPSNGKKIRWSPLKAHFDRLLHRIFTPDQLIKIHHGSIDLVKAKNEIVRKGRYDRQSFSEAHWKSLLDTAFRSLPSNQIGLPIPFLLGKVKHANTREHRVALDPLPSLEIPRAVAYPSNQSHIDDAGKMWAHAFMDEFNLKDIKFIRGIEKIDHDSGKVEELRLPRVPMRLLQYQEKQQKGEETKECVSKIEHARKDPLIDIKIPNLDPDLLVRPGAMEKIREIWDPKARDERLQRQKQEYLEKQKEARQKQKDLEQLKKEKIPAPTILNLRTTSSGRLILSWVERLEDRDTALSPNEPTIIEFDLGKENPDLDINRLKQILAKHFREAGANRLNDPLGNSFVRFLCSSQKVSIKRIKNCVCTSGIVNFNLSKGAVIEDVRFGKNSLVRMRGSEAAFINVTATSTALDLKFDCLVCKKLRLDSNSILRAPNLGKAYFDEHCKMSCKADDVDFRNSVFKSKDPKHDFKGLLIDLNRMPLSWAERAKATTLSPERYEKVNEKYDRLLTARGFNQLLSSSLLKLHSRITPEHTELEKLKAQGSTLGSSPVKSSLYQVEIPGPKKEIRHLLCFKDNPGPQPCSLYNLEHDNETHRKINLWNDEERPVHFHDALFMLLDWHYGESSEFWWLEHYSRYRKIAQVENRVPNKVGEEKPTGNKA